MVASGWVETTIGSLVENKQISIQTGPFGTVLSASEYADHGIPVVSVREIRQGRIELYDETPAVSELTYHKLSQFALKPYDLVFARKGNVDRSALIPENAQKLFLGSDGIRLRFVDPTLAQVVFHCVQSPQTRQFLTVSAYGTTMAGLNETIISSIPICIPDDSMEQQLIAKSLSDMDELIDSLEKLIAKKKSIKQGAMQELLTGKRRLPGFTGEWEPTEVRELGRIVGGGTPPTRNTEWWKGHIPWISSSDLEDGKINTIRMSRFITKDAVTHSATYLCLAGTVLVVSRVGVGKVAVAPVDLCTSQDFTNVIVDKCNPYFLAYVLSNIMKEKASTTQGTSIKGITSDEIASIKVYMPTKQEQDEIVCTLDSIDNSISSIEKKLEKARQIKQGMMQQLLTGKIKLIKKGE